MKPSKTIDLTVEAGDALVEIFVIDGRFQLAAHAAGHLEASLPPGLYKVKFKAGNVIKEVDAILEPGSPPQVIPAPDLDFSTAAPLAGTRTARADHIQAAVELSQQSPLCFGSGGQLFLFVRDLDEGFDTDPAQGLTLRSLQGDYIFSFGEQGQRSIEEQWAGCLVELDPGPYRLRLQTHVTGSIEQTIFISPGWQTQVFLLRRPFGKTEHRARRADLAAASIFIVPAGEGFQPEREGMRWTELARLSLGGGGRSGAPAGLPAQSLREGSNPLLGLLYAHLMLQARHTDLAALQELLEGLRESLGEHPDLEALHLRLAELRGSAQEQDLAFKSPPMLRSSWEVVVAASAANPRLVPPGSLSQRIAGRLWGGGPWLVWQPPEQESRRDAQAELPGLEESLHQIEELLAEQPGALQSAARSAALDNLEEGLLSYLSAGTSPFQAATRQFLSSGSTPGEENLIRSEPEEAPGRLSPERLVQALGVPGSSAQKAAASLVEKLQQESGKG
jgi:hypothetical protein